MRSSSRSPNRLFLCTTLDYSLGNMADILKKGRVSMVKQTAANQAESNFGFANTAKPEAVLGFKLGRDLTPSGMAPFPEEGRISYSTETQAELLKQFLQEVCIHSLLKCEDDKASVTFLGIRGKSVSIPGLPNAPVPVEESASDIDTDADDSCFDVLFGALSDEAPNADFEEDTIGPSFAPAGGASAEALFPHASTSSFSDDVPPAIAIGAVFDAIYQLLKNLQEKYQLKLSVPDNRELGGTSFWAAVDYLPFIIRSFDDPARMSADFIEWFNSLCNLKTPLYGHQILPYNRQKLYDEIILNDNWNPDEVTSAVKAETHFTSAKAKHLVVSYECYNLLQLCGSILHYLCKYHEAALLNGVYDNILALRECPNCHHYFTTVDRRQKYCTRKDKDTNKTCAEQKKAESKKVSAAKASSPEKKLANKITRRLYNYTLSEMYSAHKPSGIDRQAMYNLWRRKNRAHSARPDYSTWLHQIETLLPKRGESYDTFYKGLQGKELKSGLR